MVDKIKIAFIVGKQGDATYINKRIMKLKSYKLAPKWLKEGVKKFERFTVDYNNTEDVEDNGNIPSDVAIAAYINYYYSDKCDVELFDGCEVGDEWNLKDMNKMDVIYIIYGVAEILNDCPDNFKKMNLFQNIMKKTTATVVPSNDYYAYINNKIGYYKDLEKAGLPVAKSEAYDVSKIKTLKQAENLKQKLLKFGKTIIAKPALGAYSYGVKIFKNLNATKTKSILAYAEKLQKKGYKKIIVQDFVETFAENYEVRTYWINTGKTYKYVYSFASKLDVKDGNWDKFDTFAKEGGKLDNKLLEEMKKLASKTIKVTKNINPLTPWIRVDIGCCLNGGKLEKGGQIFVNELETIGCNLLTHKTEKNIIPLFAKTAYNLAKKYAKK